MASTSKLIDSGAASYSTIDDVADKAAILLTSDGDMAQLQV